MGHPIAKSVLTGEVHQRGNGINEYAVNLLREELREFERPLIERRCEQRVISRIHTVMCEPKYKPINFGIDLAIFSISPIDIKAEEYYEFAKKTFGVTADKQIFAHELKKKGYYIDKNNKWQKTRY